MVFQSYALYPHLSVYDNIPFIKKNGTFDITPNPVRLAKPLKEIGFKALYSDDNPIYLDEKTVIFPVSGPCSAGHPRPRR